MKFEIINQTNGIKAFLSGIPTQTIQTKVQECKDGNCSCNCDSEMMNKIEKIEVTPENNGTSITIIGNVDAQTIAPMMQTCLMNN